MPSGGGAVGVLQNQTSYACQSGDVFYFSYWAKPVANGLSGIANSYPNAFVDIQFSNGSTRRVFPTSATSFPAGQYTFAQGSFQIPSFLVRAP